MEIKNNANNFEKFQLLKMMYSNLQIIDENKAAYSDNEYAYIISSDGVEIAKEKKGNMQVYEKFVVVIGGTKIFIYSNKCSKEIQISNNVKISSLGVCFLRTEIGDTTTIYNTRLEKIMENRLYTYRAWTDKSKAFIKYTEYQGFMGAGRTKVAILDMTTEQMYAYDLIELNNEYTLLGTELQNINGTNYIRYKLLRHGVIITSKAYIDIKIKMYSDYIYCYAHKDNKVSEKNEYKFNLTYKEKTEKLKGILTKDGKEVIPPMYDEIEYIGASNFLLTTQKNNIEQKQIYNIDQKEFIVSNCKNIVLHENLPLLVIYFDDNVKLIDMQGRIFNVQDLGKYFYCEYNQQHTHIIKVTINNEGLKKYITNTLVAITNLQEINRLNCLPADSWVKM